MLRESKLVHWDKVALPDAWPDSLNFKNPKDLLLFFGHLLGQHKKVELPDSLPGKEIIPKYILQEFHGMPNGNYSKRITRGYISSFDRVMLGRMSVARTYMANQLAQCESVLDAGCGGGQLASSLVEVGVRNVWAIDPSPYFLQHAATDNSDIHFVQGICENMDFHDNSFDAVAACFLLHEIPPKYIDKTLQEFNRIVRPGGYVAICEPSALQIRDGLLKLLKTYGLPAVYFYILAKFIHEPFITAWHDCDIHAALKRHNFEVVGDEIRMPVRHLLARKL